ncbi:MAG: hypothetical protein KDA89_24070 [Planctomycetaceae bacterium]|nr:hypothetical protein [Planctomycetaceae bacterium]
MNVADPCALAKVMRIGVSTILLMCLLSGSPAASADEALSLRDPRVLRSQVLVLNSGRVVDGQLLPRPGGYDILLPGGRIFVASEQVRFLADDQDDAYDKLRASLPELTPETHLQLAQWCLTNKLPDKARREVLDALHLDPYRADAKQMLQALERERQRASVSSGSAATSQQSGMTHPDISQVLTERRLTAPERRSLGGLPVPLARSFTQTVQPLLLNKCGNGRCHGGSRDDFALVTLRQGESVAVTEQNFAAVLNQIDFHQPAASRLLQNSIGLHGGIRQPVFSGQTGRLQMELLRNWVNQVADELAPAESVREEAVVKERILRHLGRADSHTALDDDGSLTSAEAHASFVSTNPIDADLVNVNSTGADGPLRSDRQAAIPDIGTRRSVRDSDEQQLHEAAARVRHDEFDPMEFNKRYHP